MEREFKGVWIAKEIWLDKRLSALDKVILAEIDSLDTEKGCYASNEYLAEFCQCSRSKVTSTVARLIEYGYIEVESFDGRHRVLRSRLLKNSTLPDKKSEADHEKVDAINKPTKQGINIEYIVGYLNNRAGTQYKTSTGKTRELIKARANEGFTERDFEIVIDKKTKEWKGTAMEQYIRPQTLFGNKFEAYLNQKVRTSNPFKEKIGGAI